MTTFPGILPVLQEPAEKRFVKYNTDPTVPDTAREITLFGTHLPQTRLDTSSTKSGVLFSNQANVFGNVFLAPMAFDKGFITEDSEETIEIWNADYENEAVISTITEVNPQGTDFDMPILPQTIPRGDYEQHTFTVLEAGPAIQDTHFIYTIGAAVYDVTVTGKRIVVFPYEMTWEGGLEFEYKLETVIFRTESFKEQRRNMFEVPEVSMRAGFLEQLPVKTTFFIDVETFSKKVLGIPVYQEIILPVEDLQGLSTINTAESIEYYFYMQNLASLALFTRISDPTINELKEIASVGVNSFSTVVDVINEFPANDTAIYPVFVGNIEQKKHKAKSDLVIKTDLAFRELFL